MILPKNQKFLHKLFSGKRLLKILFVDVLDKEEDIVSYKNTVFICNRK